MKPTIASAKNVLPDKPEIMLLKDTGGTVILCLVFKMIYAPAEQQKAPTLELIGKAQGEMI